MPVFDFRKDAKTEGNDRKLTEIPVASIRRNPYQPRVTFDEESIAELAQSIRQVGLIQPLVVRKAPDGAFELVAGERRLRAVKSLGMESVTCIVEQGMEDESSAMMALIENLQREDLHYLEEAQCYNTLLSTYNLTQEELAARLGKSQSSIANKLRLLRLPEEVKSAMAEAHLTERHARALLKLKDEKTQLALVDKIAKKMLEFKARGKQNFIIVVAENIGHADEIAKLLQEKTGIESRSTILGHVQRGGSPTVRDRVVATEMGYYAVELLEQGIGNRVVGMQGGKIVDFDIQEALAMSKPYDEKLHHIAEDVAF